MPKAALARTKARGPGASKSKSGRLADACLVRADGEGGATGDRVGSGSALVSAPSACARGAGLEQKAGGPGRRPGCASSPGSETGPVASLAFAHRFDTPPGTRSALRVKAETFRGNGPG